MGVVIVCHSMLWYQPSTIPWYWGTAWVIDVIGFPLLDDFNPQYYNILGSTIPELIINQSIPIIIYQVYPFISPSMSITIPELIINQGRFRTLLIWWPPLRSKMAVVFAKLGVVPSSGSHKLCRWYDWMCIYLHIYIYIIIYEYIHM